MIFSGSIIHDADNVSGFGSSSGGALVAYYTGHTRAEPQRQVQCIAFSNDGGERWQKYHANPVIDLGLAHFRDPKVFWHAGSKKWVMLTVLAAERAVLFFSSDNLLDWTNFHRFDAPIEGQDEWECPDLVELPVTNGKAGETRWVLFVSVGGNAPAGGVGVQYFVGDFDGTTFRLLEHEEDRWVDYGPDFYAPQSFSGIETTESGGVWLGWMNNWIYAKDTLAKPSRGMMTLARRLSLQSVGDQIELVQNPIAPISAEMRNLSFCNEIILKGDDRTTLEFSAITGERAIVSIDLSKGEVLLDRSQQSARLPERFRKSYSMHWPVSRNETTSVVYDHKGIEVFAAGGRRVFTALFQFEAPSVSCRRDDETIGNSKQVTQS